MKVLLTDVVTSAGKLYAGSRFNPIGDATQIASIEAMGGLLVDEDDIGAGFLAYVDGQGKAGSKRLVQGELVAKLAYALNAKTRLYHAPIVTPSAEKSTTGKEPTAIAVNALLLLQFTLNADAAWRQFKVGGSFVSNPAFHIHWTKTSDANELGKVVRWRISYVTFDGSTEDGAVAPSVLEVEDTYENSGTTSRVVHRTVDLPATGFAPGRYLGILIEAITPVGTPMASQPGLFSCDLTYTEWVTR